MEQGGGFRFKQFGVMHDKSAMKVGTDAVLLGAWSGLDSSMQRALDIGAGCGVIGLMLAQRGREWGLNVDLVEIDSSSATQAEENIAASPWSDRLRVFNSSIQDYAESISHKYDLIVSNPPYFNDSLHSPILARTIARHTTQLTFMELVNSSNKLLAEEGLFAIILPYQGADDFIELAVTAALKLEERVDILPNPSSKPNRSLLQFVKRERVVSTKQSQLALRDESGQFSEDYINLTRDFYLHF